MKLKPVKSKASIKLGDADAKVRGSAKGDDALKRAMKKDVKRISERQRVLYADGRHALLVVLQGRDASGKDGTIRKVFSSVNPLGCRVASFKVPTELERQHDFLWRIHQQVPPRGMIGIFNRSHYEDVIVPRVHGRLPMKALTARYDAINDFERMLADNGVAILKFYLHISRGEQKKRLSERLTDPAKNWKFSAGDLDDRRHWDAFTRAYRGVLERTSTAYAPWFIVPADDKATRNRLVAQAVADALDKLDLRYPKADPSVLKLEIE